MVAPQVVFYGTQEESCALVNAIARNCACAWGALGVRTSTCAPHNMLISDQRALNGLLFMRRHVTTLALEEFAE